MGGRLLRGGGGVGRWVVRILLFGERGFVYKLDR